MAQRLSIGDLAKATGTKVETIRYYEGIGLLPRPTRTAGNYRSFKPDHLFRLGFIRRARDLGFSLDEVRDLIRLADDRDRPCGEIDTIAQRHLDDVERKIADLERLRKELKSLIKQCHRGTIADCRIVDALATSAPRPASTKTPASA
ncbi:MerR family transcriptional regulator [Hypericibacter sp.]|uniref:MerR family transcriptional regulator n=1 Tax=Hypericibacter sp. TaxID=2705401 RepID=UPI003D6D4212